MKLPQSLVVTSTLLAMSGCNSKEVPKNQERLTEEQIEELQKGVRDQIEPQNFDDKLGISTAPNALPANGDKFRSGDPTILHEGFGDYGEILTAERKLAASSIVDGLYLMSRNNRLQMLRIILNEVPSEQRDIVEQKIGEIALQEEGEELKRLNDDLRKLLLEIIGRLDAEIQIKILEAMLEELDKSAHEQENKLA